MHARLIALAIAILAGPAMAATRTFTVTSFDRVRVEGPFAVTIHTGAGSSASAEGPDRRTLDGVRVEVQGRTLVIGRDRAALPGGASLRGIRIAASTPTLLAASVLGAGTLAIDRVRGARFDGVVSGAGGLSIAALDVEALSILAAGAGNATLAGKARSVRGTIQGAGTIAGEGLSADDVVVTSAGAGDIVLAATRTAKVTASGSGNVRIVGRPACTVQAEGTVEVECMGPAGR